MKIKKYFCFFFDGIRGASVMFFISLPDSFIKKYRAPGFVGKSGRKSG